MGDGAVAAEVVVPCPDLDAAISFFTERLGFELERISPADDPRQAVVSGYGLRLRLDRLAGGHPPTVVLRCDDPRPLGNGATTLVGPGNVRVELVDLGAPLAVPPVQPSLTVSRARDHVAEAAGRAGMRYRDLIPDRQGGRFIASHIRIPDAGPVPDYVHHHRLRFQIIHCARGAVRLVYEDQGPPFELAAGDSVLQPPGIRHRVLASTAGAEVVEIACPAEHDTFVDHDLGLPTHVVRTDREFGGQRFVRERAATAVWMPWRVDGFVCRESGIAAATHGLVASRVVRTRGTPSPTAQRHGGELMFWFVLDGRLGVAFDDHRVEQLERADAVTVPAGTVFRIVDASGAVELLEVTVPAEIGAA